MKNKRPNYQSLLLSEAWQCHFCQCTKLMIK